MNEPSVSKLDESTMLKEAKHVQDDGTSVYHRDVHNAYGFLMQKATYRGLLERDKGNQRPFVLTRSAFIGSQKFGAKWTGDNAATANELSISINQILSLSIAGIHFVGADIPGFYGKPSDELYILFY
jgi:alpha-glucosidase (family GH31 glycosyl hydrolase)